MEYRMMNGMICLRVDPGESLCAVILEVLQREKVRGGWLQGIGACDAARLSTYLPEKNEFVSHRLSGMLELVSLSGNASTAQDGRPFLHAHAVFSYLDESGAPRIAAGHLEDARVSYTGEVAIFTAPEKIGRRFDAGAGIDVWDFSGDPEAALCRKEATV